MGDSITEGWTGHFYHNPESRVQGAFSVFQSFFSKRNGGKYEGLPQGIAGDTIPALLWRIQNGEIGTCQTFQERTTTTPFPVFWVLIGTNDLGNTGCSPEIIIVGIVRIVEEILIKQPSALVVVHGLLPRTFDRSVFLMQSKGKSPVLWPVIQTINAKLAKYAAKRNRVEYFESNAFFKENTVFENHNNELRIDHVLMTDYLHPSAAGYRKYGAEIVQKLDDIYADPKNIHKAEDESQTQIPGDDKDDTEDDDSEGR